MVVPGEGFALVFYAFRKPGVNVAQDLGDCALGRRVVFEVEGGRVNECPCTLR